MWGRWCQNGRSGSCEAYMFTSKVLRPCMRPSPGSDSKEVGLNKVWQRFPREDSKDSHRKFLKGTRVSEAKVITAANTSLPSLHSQTLCHCNALPQLCSLTWYYEVTWEALRILKVVHKSKRQRGSKAGRQELTALFSSCWNIVNKKRERDQLTFFASDCLTAYKLLTRKGQGSHAVDGFCRHSYS